MRWMDRFDRHAELLDRMAGTLGVDLTEEMLQGHLPPEHLRGLVLSCMGCRDDGACEGWLAENAGGADAAPGFCRNRERLKALAVPG
jgi:hypothetical protein